RTAATIGEIVKQAVIHCDCRRFLNPHKRKVAVANAAAGDIARGNVDIINAPLRSTCANTDIADDREILEVDIRHVVEPADGSTGGFCGAYTASSGANRCGFSRIALDDIVISGSA